MEKFTNENIIIYYSKNSYKLLYQRPHQILRNFDNSWEKIFITSDLVREYIPNYNLHVWMYTKRRLIFKNITQIHKVIIYYTDPRLFDEIIEFKNTFPNTKVLFDLIDAPLEEFVIWKPNLSKALENCDYLIYSHPKLIDFINFDKIITKPHYISNGCDYELFKQAIKPIYPRPDDLPKFSSLIDKKILGYYGAFSHWIDWDIVKKYADSGLYHLVMIGGIENSPDYNIRFIHPNITWISHKPYEELVIYLSWFDECFLPFKKIELNKYVNPCKLWEYMASEKPIIKYNIEIDDSKIQKYSDICENIKNIIMNNNINFVKTKITIVSIFYNNESIVKFYKNNLKILEYDPTIKFNLVCNDSKDNTLNLLYELKSSYPNNINIFETKTNGCSIARNIGFANCKNTKYVIFLDSDFNVEFDHIIQLIEQLDNKIKYSGYYGGILNNPYYVGGDYIYSQQIIKNINEKKYLGSGFSACEYQWIFDNKINFDENYDPFVISDVDFSYQILLKGGYLKKLVLSNTIIHLESQTISKQSSYIYKFQLEKNSIIFSCKYFTQSNYKIFDQLTNHLNMKTIGRLKTLNYKKFQTFQTFQTINWNSTALITKFNNLLNPYKYNLINSDIDNIKKYSTLIVDIHNYDYVIQYIDPKLITLIIDTKDLDEIIKKKLFYSNTLINSICTINNFTKLLIENIFNIYSQIPLFELEYKKIQPPNNKIIYFHTFYSKYIQTTINILSKFMGYHLIIYDPNYNMNLKTTESISIINIFDIDKITCPDYYIDMDGEYTHLQIYIQNKVKVIVGYKFPNCELVKPTINGELVKIEGLRKSNTISNDISIDVDDYFNVIEKILKF